MNTTNNKIKIYEYFTSQAGNEKIRLTPEALEELTARQAVTCEEVDGEVLMSACWNGFYCLVNIIWRDFGNIHPTTVLTQFDLGSIGMSAKEFLAAIRKIRGMTMPEVNNLHLHIPRLTIYTILTLTIKVLLNQVIYGHFWCLMNKEQKVLQLQLLEWQAAGKMTADQAKDAATNYGALFDWLDQFVAIVVDRMNLIGIPTEPIDYDTDDVVTQGGHIYRREGIKRNLMLSFSMTLFDNLPDSHGIGGVVNLNMEIKDPTKCKCCGFREDGCERPFPICVLCKQICENEFGNSIRGLGGKSVTLNGYKTIINEKKDVCCNNCNRVYVVPRRLRVAETVPAGVRIVPDGDGGFCFEGEACDPPPSVTVENIKLALNKVDENTLRAIRKDKVRKMLEKAREANLDVDFVYPKLCIVCPDAAELNGYIHEWGDHLDKAAAKKKHDDKIIEDKAAAAEAKLLRELEAEPKQVKAEKKKEKKVNKFACPCGDKNCMPRPSKTAWVNGVKRDQTVLQNNWDRKHQSSGKHSDSSSDI